MTISLATGITTVATIVGTMTAGIMTGMITVGTMIIGTMTVGTITAKIGSVAALIGGATGNELMARPAPSN
jgi:hypothetical protein